MFWIYLQLGYEHIADFNGYDHILFLVALSATYLITDWKQLGVLITGFTIGHSVTLALATLQLVKISTPLVEFLIPVTIFISAFADFFYKDTNSGIRMRQFKYISAVFFGLIHGLGFSNYLRAMLEGAENLFFPLLAFNIGLEIGQILIVSSIMLVSWFLVKKIGIPKRDWTLIIAGASAGISLVMLIERAADL